MHPLNLGAELDHDHDDRDPVDDDRKDDYHDDMIGRRSGTRC